MEEKSIVINIPDGMCIDESKSTFEKIVFKKKKNTKPRSWEEYCCQQKINDKTGYYINSVSSEICKINWDICTHSWKGVLPSKELAEAFLAMMQLMSLRQEWISDWKPDWNDSTNWCIIFREGELRVDFYNYTAQPLSFPTEEMATDFFNCFKDLLKIAKPLI